ncbi:MAG: hypothetical protein KBF82_08810 [Chitinophagaceae bacterium]|nr:hypothetical protein [Chitinophagaceae bacterium]
MKKIFFSVALVVVSAVLFAQGKEDEDKGFKKENLFTGGSVTLSFFNGSTIIGANPIFGYKLADFVDAGIVTNFISTSQRDYLEFDDKVKQTVYGGGIFTRLYPVNFLFLQGQFEHNFINLKYTPASSSYLPYKETKDVNSFLVGGGYCQGRQPGSNTFYYVAILFDVIKNENSPYVNVAVDPNTNRTSVRAAPLIRAGFNIGLFEGRNRGR